MTINWSGLYKKYKGQWVALGDNEMTVLGSGKTAKEALQQAKKKGYSSPILTHLPERLVTYVGFFQNEV